jgi:hypothetical protein
MRAMSPATPRGPEAARLRQRKFARLRGLTIPVDGLPGSLVITHVRCGKPTCHCAQGEGHPHWTLTFMLQGKKQVEHIPQALVAEVQREVEAGRQFKDALTEVFTINAQLLVLRKRQRPRPRRR